jgi:hypothetical protein
LIEKFNDNPYGGCHALFFKDPISQKRGGVLFFYEVSSMILKGTIYQIRIGGKK